MADSFRLVLVSDLIEVPQCAVSPHQDSLLSAILVVMFSHVPADSIFIEPTLMRFTTICPTGNRRASDQLQKSPFIRQTCQAITCQSSRLLAG
jgi:hypothetical protein